MFNEKNYNQKMDKTFDVFIKELNIKDLKIKNFYRLKIGE